MKKPYFLLLAGTLFAACGQSYTPTEAHNHSHGVENTKLNYTGLDGQLEIFAEYHPLIRNSAAEFVVYLTSLDDYRAAQSAKVTISLVSDEGHIAKQIDTAIVPGIYKTVLVPKISGKGILIFDIDLNGEMHHFKVAVNVFSDHRLFRKSYKAPVLSVNRINFPKEKSWKVDFGVSKVSKTGFSGVIKAPANITAVVADQQSIVAAAPGIVEFHAVLTMGSRVQAGQSLFSISGANLTGDNLNVSAKEAGLNQAKAKADYERALALRSDQIISEKDYQSAVTAYELAQLEYRTHTRNFSGKSLQIRSAKSGFLTDLMIAEGQYVQAGQQLATVATGKMVQLTAYVPPAYAMELSQVSTANFKINNKLYELDQLKGKLSSYGRTVDASGLIPVVFSINNHPGFFPGMPAEAYLLTKAGNAVLQIPETAIMEDQGTYFVYVQLDGANYEKRVVETGQSNGKMVQIKHGLLEGEILVTEGAYNLKLAAGQNAVPAHGHHH